MAKIVKDTRETIDVDLELSKIENKKSSSGKKKEVENKKVSSKNKSNNTKKEKKRSGIIGFFRDVKNEVSKVKWPSKKEMFKYSMATIIFIVFFAGFFYLIDLIIALLKAGV